jgi:hypothetical protein
LKRLLPALSYVVLEFTLCLALVTIAVFGFMTTRPNPPQLWDLGLFILASRAASLDLNPYVPRPELMDGWKTTLEFTTVPSVNPPHSVLMFQPAAWVDPLVQAQVVYATSIAAYLALVVLLAVVYRDNLSPSRIAWMLALAAFWQILAVFNVYTYVALIAGIAWVLATKGRWTLAGIALGILAAIKMNFLTLPALLFLAGYRKVAAVSLVPFAAIWALPVIAYGPDVYLQWLAVIPPSFPASPDYWINMNNASLVAQFGRMGLPQAGMPLSVLLLGCLAAWVWATRPRPTEVMPLGLVAGVLAAPLGYLAYFLCLLPVFISRRRWSPLLTVAAFLMLIPHQFIWKWAGMGPLEMAAAGSVYFFAYVLVAVDLVKEQLASRSRALPFTRRPSPAAAAAPE